MGLIIMKKTAVNIPSLKVNISWTFLGNIIYALTQWGILVSLTKLGTPTMVGQYTLGLALTAPVVMLTNLQARTVQATDIENEYSFGEFLGLRTVSVLLYFMVMGVITFTVSSSNETLLVVLLITIAKAVESISDIIYGLMQKNEIMKNIAVSKILKGVSSLIIVSLILSITNNIISSIIGLIFTWFFLLIIVDLRYATKMVDIKPIFNSRKMLNLIKVSTPLGIAHMLSSLNTNIPRYILEHYINEEALGYFAAIAYLLVAGSTIIVAVGHAVTPRLSKYYKVNKPKFKKLLLKLMLLGFFIGILGFVIASIAGEYILAIVYSSEYAQYNNILILVVIAGLFTFTGAFLGYGITAAKMFRIQPYMNIIWITASALSGFILIPKYGISGAAYTLIVSSIIQFLTRVIVLIYINKKYN